MGVAPDDSASYREGGAPVGPKGSGPAVATPAVDGEGSVGSDSMVELAVLEIRYPDSRDPVSRGAADYHFAADSAVGADESNPPSGVP